MAHVSTAKQRASINKIVDRYLESKTLVEQFQNALQGALASSKPLMKHIHSLKVRLKDPENLREKLKKKMVRAAEAELDFDVTPDNVLVKVNDLGGIRLLHLYTRQIREIDVAIKDVLAEQQYELIEGPFARTWDDESRAFFEDCGIATQTSETMYTSVHYVVGSASRTRVTCEIQVRTLMEEVWGEVDHIINYPNPSTSLACREQLKVLARVTSSATRLVDSIFLTLADHERTRAAVSETRAKKKGNSGPTRRKRAKPKT
jgi:putative GTP pyrophosphokinase